ncbi:organ-specific protein S2-like [Punica granatum]|uniref:Uncharacterized protein n=2 Tax=Punica granatum TaxID=22663 RepID=A0A218XW39_PUNGR|nr:organ-specific protein S2-like [Punica granatum]OWM89184.1 hypothetical protein CDL15_Pgr010470 [Punica granatum]PKI33189.1 hypothetical protein CRG98_046410 [Punica granatum]
MMKPFCAFIIPFSLLLLLSFTHARKDPAGDYWKKIMKDQPMPEAIRDLIVRPRSKDNHHFVKDFDVRRSVIIYPARVDPKDNMSSDTEDLKSGHNDASSTQHVNLKVPDQEQKNHENGA